jgi:hypothetical protein
MIKKRIKVTFKAHLKHLKELFSIDSIAYIELESTSAKIKSLK